MTTTSATAWTARIADPRLALSLRVAAYAEAHADAHGHAPLLPGALARAVDPSGLTRASSLSRAIRVAVAGGWLHEMSGGRCLVLSRGTPLAPCPAIHRGETSRAGKS